MIRDTLFVAGRDLVLMLRSWETLLWVFVMPVIFIAFIGNVTGSFGGRGVTKPQLPVEAPDDAGFLLDRLVQRLEEQDYVVLRPDSAGEFSALSRRLTVPSGFTDSVLAGTTTTLTYRHGAEGMGNSYENVRVGRAIYTVLADVAAGAGAGEAPTRESLERLDRMPRALTLDVTSAGERRRVPSGFEQAIPGIMVMFILLVMTTSGAVHLVAERNGGLLRRLASAPISRLSVVLGKWLGKLGLGIVQILYAMAVGTVLFKMDWGADLPMVIAVLAVYGAMMASVGMLLGCVARTDGQAAAVGVISANALAALGGCWWPIEVAPQWMQKLQLFLPTGWAMDAMHRLISFAAGPASVLPHVIGMALAAALLLAVTTRVFRFQQ